MVILFGNQSKNHLIKNSKKLVIGMAFRAQDLVKDLATVTLDEKDLSKIVGLINTHYNLKLELQTPA